MRRLGFARVSDAGPTLLWPVRTGHRRQQLGSHALRFGSPEPTLKRMKDHESRPWRGLPRVVTADVSRRKLRPMARTDLRAHGVLSGPPQSEPGGPPARGVLECGSLLPLSELPANQPRPQSARGLAQSKTWRRAAALIAVLALASVALAHSYSVDWWKVAGGGGTSTGGGYAVSGTIGQPDAGGPMTNGQYSVTGGFWALPVAVQTPEAPVLSIAVAGPGQVRISWTPATPGFALQSTHSLSPTNWTAAPSGANNPAFVPATEAARFYRLLRAGP